MITKKQKEELKNAGANDQLLEEILEAHAQNYIDEMGIEGLNDQNEAIVIYKEGFFGG